MILDKRRVGSPFPRIGGMQLQKRGLRGIEWVIFGADRTETRTLRRLFWITVGRGICHQLRMARAAKRSRRLWDTYWFRGFRPEPTVRGIFGDPKALVIGLKRRSKKRRAAVAAASRWAGTTEPACKKRAPQITRGSGRPYEGEGLRDFGGPSRPSTRRSHFGFVHFQKRGHSPDSKRPQLLPKLGPKQATPRLRPWQSPQRSYQLRN